jgi:hypothetical protein
MIEYIATGVLLGSGFYLLLLGIGCDLRPVKSLGAADIAVLGRIMLFLGALLLPICFG